MQYTIRSIPLQLDRVLRKHARESGISLNQMLLEVLVRGAGLDAQKLARRDLSDLCGRMKADSAFDEAIRDQEEIDAALWP